MPDAAAPCGNVPSSSDAERLFHHVFRGVPGGGAIALFSGRWDHASGRLTDIHDTQRATYPQAAGFAADWLAAEAAAGREAYACAHLLTDRRRIAANAAPIQAIWTDSDGAQPPERLPAPTAVVESSPGRHYHFWRLSHAIAPAQAAALNRRIAHAMGADAGGWDLSQVLRWPGTLHGKTATRYPVLLVTLDDDRTVDPDELDRLLPPAPGRTAPPTSAPLTDADEPPVVLDASDLETWRGQRPALHPDGAIDRSETLYKIAAVLHAAGATRRTIAAALAERDAAFGWQKYAGRPAEYDRIAGKLADTPRAGRAADPFPPDERIAALERDLTEARDQIARLREQRDAAEARARAHGHMIDAVRAYVADPDIGNELRLLIGLELAHYGRDPALENIAGNRWRLTQRLARALCGVRSVATAGRYARRLAAAGLLPLGEPEIARFTKPSGERVEAEILTYRYEPPAAKPDRPAAVAEGNRPILLDRARRLAAKRDARGDRRRFSGCPEHPHARAVMRRHCSVCDRCIAPRAPNVFATTPASRPDQVLQGTSLERLDAKPDRQPPCPHGIFASPGVSCAHCGPSTPRCRSCGNPTEGQGYDTCRLCIGAGAREYASAFALAGGGG